MRRMECLRYSESKIRIIMAAQTRALVSAKWLADAIKSNLIGPNLRILDTSWYLAKLKRDANAEFNQQHIPGTSFFDIDKCSDKTSSMDHMLPTANYFAEYVGGLGIGNDTHVVVYDTSDFGSYSAPRVWWMFRLFGHNSVSVLDGGMKNWLAEGHPVTAEYTKPGRADFKATANHSWVKSYEDVLKNIETKQVQVIDARSAGRFRGTEPEPRDDIEPGHIPGTINMPFAKFMDASGKELELEVLAKMFREAGVDLEKPFWVTLSVYDGSWSEWFKRAAPEHVISEGKGKQV
ncbi:unnamed protein product [Oncorhynchus mykiss]|uniref:Rhodanese domain-containing protein n=1 Tax=Oncorhynchus mykiss TaxID=8022 RepID=A0A060WC75_ONCMY|nr:unnamed protein product [Oncorhynchus mykiss]